MLSPVLDGFTHPALPCPNVRQGTGADVCHEGLLTWHRSCHRRAHATDRLMGRHKDGRYCVSVERASSSGGHQAAGQPGPRHGTVRRRPSVCLSVLLCGPGRRTCQGHSGNTHILHIACRWHGQWQQDWCVRQAVVSDMREGKRAPRGRRPAIVHETQGADSSGQSRTSPAGSDDNADILYQPAGVFAPLHHDALGARHPRVHDTRCLSPRRPSWHPPHAGW